MLVLKKKNIFLVFLLVLFLNVGCQKKGEGELAPFFDELYFKYKEGSIGNNYIIYSVKEIDCEYEIIKEDASPTFPGTTKYIVDFWGFIKKAPAVTRTKRKWKKSKSWIGTRIGIWLPASELQVGKKLTTSTIGKCRVEEKKTWEKWDVWVLKDGLGNEHYYDIKTGFWVGCNILTLAGGRKTILIDTNADISY